MTRISVTILFSTAFILFITSGCSSKQSGPYNYKLYPGDKRSDEHIVKLFLENTVYDRRTDVIYINDMRVNDYDQVELLPGKYKINTMRHELKRPVVNVDIDYNQRMDLATCELEVELIGGYAYHVNTEINKEELYCISVSDSKTGGSIGNQCCSH